MGAFSLSGNPHLSVSKSEQAPPAKGSPRSLAMFSTQLGLMCSALLSRHSLYDKSSLSASLVRR